MNTVKLDDAKITRRRDIIIAYTKLYFLPFFFLSVKFLIDIKQISVFRQACIHVICIGLFMYYLIHKGQVHT